MHFVCALSCFLSSVILRRFFFACSSNSATCRGFPYKNSIYFKQTTWLGEMLPCYWNRWWFFSEDLSTSSGYSQHSGTNNVTKWSFPCEFIDEPLLKNKSRFGYLNLGLIGLKRCPLKHFDLLSAWLQSVLFSVFKASVSHAKVEVTFDFSETILMLECGPLVWGHFHTSKKMQYPLKNKSHIPVF